MTSPFVVTAGADTVPVSRLEPAAAATGSATFTVANQSALDESLRLKVVAVEVTTPDGTALADESWFSIDRDARPLAAGASDQVRVEATIPPETAVGIYAFTLQAYSGNGVPEETTATSPQVRLRVDERFRKPLPRWVWGAVAAVVLVVAGVTWQLLQTDVAAVPDLIGLDEVAALEALTDDGLVGAAQEVDEFDPDKVGLVVGQSPAPGEPIPLGETVEFSVGRQPGLLPAPEITAPTSGSQVSSDGPVEFRWNAVEDATAYKVSLFKTDGSLSTFCLREILEAQIVSPIEIGAEPSDQPAGPPSTPSSFSTADGPEVSFALPDDFELVPIPCPPRSTELLSSLVLPGELVFAADLANFNLDDSESIRFVVGALDQGAVLGLTASAAYPLS